MKLYEVRANTSAPIVPFSHIVVASNKEQAIQMIANNLNTTQTAILYRSSYFCANEIAVDNFSEPTILVQGRP